MPSRPPLSVVIPTLNEEHNIVRCLRSCVPWAAEVLVVDSGSTDRTRELASAEGAKVVQHKWEGYGQQKNWGLSQASGTWVLFLDADEEVTPALRDEILAFVAVDGQVGGQRYRGAHFPRKTWFLGRWILHGGWYPNRLVRLVHRDGARWTEPAVHESLRADGPVHAMREDLLHYTFRDVGQQVMTNVRFARLGAKVALDRGERGSLARILLKPVGKFLETYVWKRGFLDGFPGLVISMNAAHSLFMKYVELRFLQTDRTPLKKILIIDNTFDPPHGCPEIQALVRKAAENLGPVEVTAVRAPESQIPARLEDFDGVVLSGSKTSIEETAPWIEAEMDAIRRLHSLKIPTFGICYGEQLIARTLGAPTGTARQYEYGWVEIDTSKGASALFEGLPPKFHSFEYHRDEVRQLPANFTLTAESKDCPVQAYDVKDAPMWGVQFHPERGLEHGEKSLARVRERGDAVVNGDQGSRLYDPTIGETIFRNFLKKVWGRP